MRSGRPLSLAGMASVLRDWSRRHLTYKNIFQRYEATPPHEMAAAFHARMEQIDPAASAEGARLLARVAAEVAVTAMKGAGLGAKVFLIPAPGRWVEVAKGLPGQVVDAIADALFQGAVETAKEYLDSLLRGPNPALSEYVATEHPLSNYVLNAGKEATVRFVAHVISTSLFKWIKLDAEKYWDYVNKAHPEFSIRESHKVAAWISKEGIDWLESTLGRLTGGYEKHLLGWVQDEKPAAVRDQ